jgi:hypothetical protein
MAVIMSHTMSGGRGCLTVALRLAEPKSGSCYQTVTLIDCAHITTEALTCTCGARFCWLPSRTSRCERFDFRLSMVFKIVTRTCAHVLAHNTQHHACARATTIACDARAVCSGR